MSWPRLLNWPPRQKRSERMTRCGALRTNKPSFLNTESGLSLLPSEASVSAKPPKVGVVRNGVLRSQNGTNCVVEKTVDKLWSVELRKQSENRL